MATINERRYINDLESWVKQIWLLPSIEDKRLVALDMLDNMEFKGKIDVFKNKIVTARTGNIIDKLCTDILLSGGKIKGNRVIMDNIITTDDIHSSFYKEYGEKQLLKCVEEMSELQKEVIKYIMKPNMGTLNNIEGEIGDVFNSIDSLIFGLGLDLDKINKDRLEKLNKYYEIKMKG